MQSINFDVSGMGDLNRALEAAEKMFPESAEKALKKETRITAKDLKEEVKDEIHGHGSKPHTLENSFHVGRVMKSGSKMTCAVTTDAPHYHLVEEGHEASGWYEDSPRDVPGRKIVARYMAKRSEDAEQMAKDLLDEIFKRAGWG